MNSSCFMICVLDSFYGNSKAFSCYSRKMFFRKGFEPEVHGNLTRLEFLVFTHACNEIGRGFRF